MSALTVQIVDFEEELDLVVRSFPRELVHGIDELFEGDGAAVVLVEDLENSVGEEGLKQRMDVNPGVSETEMDKFITIK